MPTSRRTSVVGTSAVAAALLFSACASNTDGTGAAPASGTGDDGCSAAVADGVSARAVDLFQVVRIGIVEDGRLVGRDDDATAVIAGKPALVRVSLDGAPDGAFSVRVRLDGEDGEVRWARTDAQGVATVRIPADQVPTDAVLDVEVAGCEGDEGSALPVVADEPLEAIAMEELTVVLVPFTVNGVTPDTSEEVVDGYRDALIAHYPISDARITVREAVDAGTNDNLGDLLVDVGRIRDADDVPRNVYYYGMVSGVGSREEFDGNTGTSEQGTERSVGFGIGAAFADARSEGTFVHELGHANGLMHAPCGDPDMLDQGFPNPDGTIGIEGWDSRADELLPPTTPDLMSYCSPRWLGDYHYDLLVERLQVVQTLAD